MRVMPLYSLRSMNGNKIVKFGVMRGVNQNQ